MFNRLVTDSIHLRILELRDVEQLYALTHTSRQHLREWLPWVDHVESVDDSRQFIQSTLSQYAGNNGFQLGIWYRETLAGVIGLHHIDWPNRSTAIGYWLGQDFQGLGIMTKACQSLVDFLFDDYQLNRVEIEVATQNFKSQAIPDRLGFVNEGCRRQAEWLYNHFVDHIIYSMLEQDWHPNR